MCREDDTAERQNAEVMMKRAAKEHDAFTCPVNAALDLLSARWTLHIVRCLLGGKRRFNELAREIGVNPRTLRARLRALEREGAVRRTVVSTMPPYVEYDLTEKGRAMNRVFEALADWGRQWMSPPDVGQASGDERA